MNQNFASTQAPLEAKSLSFLDETMAFEALAAKKCMAYANQLTEQPLKDMANQLAQHHRAHFDALYSYLENHR